MAFSKDGYLWVGTYAGLYQYDGSSFKMRNDYKSVRNVNSLFADEEGRLWIGTNDNGLSVRVGDRIANSLDVESGLSSNSVKSIGQDVFGNYYIGTTGKLNVVQLSGGMEVSGTIEQVNYALSIAASATGLVAVTTNSGKTHVIRNARHLYSFSLQDAMATCALFPGDGDTLYLGTARNGILVCEAGEDSCQMIGEIHTGPLKFIKSMKKDENGILWVCADNGVGFVNSNNEFVRLETGKFTNSIDSMGIDYQGNLWFTSSRLGLLRVSESAFSNIHDRAKIKTDVLNAVAFWNGRWYFGTDDGLDVTDGNFSLMEDPLSARLEGQRIRSLLVDSRNHLWICVASGEGLLEVLPESGDSRGEVRAFNARNGAISSRFRTALELSDGTIAAGEYTGLDFVSPEEGRVVASIRPESLPNPMVLSLCEGADGTLYAGTDGGGLVLVRREEGQFKVSGVISRKDGLTSDVILKIVREKNGGGIFILAGNGISYLNPDGKIQNLENFPYSNNFDLYESDDGKLFVLSGAGIFVVDKDSLLSGGKIDYALLNERAGLSGSITANSKNLALPDGRLYVCCDDGCYVIDTKKYAAQKAPYRMLVDYVIAGGARQKVSKNSSIEISGGSGSLVIHPVLLNFMMNEPFVGLRLEGFEEEKIVRAKELGELTYSNLPNGSYNFRMNLYSDGKDEILESVSYQVVKSLRIFDHLWFKFYFGLVCALFVAWCTWVASRQYNKKIIAEEKRRAALAEMNARMSNETIMTIAQTVDARDARTSRHSVRVSEYSVQIARRLGWPRDRCEDIRKMGLLHDIGKIAIPDAVLNKAARLSEEEYALMKTHVERGAEILRHFTLVKNVDLGAKYHHERYDGSGYPQGLKGGEIPIYARIIGIADAFDAMTSNRVYRNQLDLKEVLGEMERCKGTQFDPELTDIFLELIRDGTIDVEVLYR